MKKATWLVLMLCVMVFGVVGISHADGFVKNSTIYACVNNGTGAMKIVNTITATLPYCGPLERETLLMFQAYTGIDKVLYGHISAFGGQSDAGVNGYSVYHFLNSGRYEIDFNLPSAIPTCMATATVAQCKVTSKGAGVTIDCVAPTISSNQTITYVPADTDFDFICVN